MNELLRADLLKALPYELRGLVKPEQTGRQQLAAVKMSCKSKTREVNRIEYRLTSLVLTNKQDFTRFIAEFEDIQTLISELPGRRNAIYKFSPEILRSKFLKR